MARGQNLFNLGQYSFSSWARRGVGNNITTNGTSLIRARIPLNISLNSEVITQDVELLGPADIANITQNAIVRTSPIDRNVDFEWNMLPYIEFYDEDFLWRYTPDAPENGNLRPWLALVVLKSDEFIDLPSPRGQLQAIRLQTEVLPLSADIHLWAHMHTGEYAGVTSLDKALDQINKNVKLDPNGFTCRLLSPRRLELKTMYYAFLIPSYETGRLAGLGENFTNVPARQAAWTDTNRPVTLDFPIYHRWSFATSESSFEDLISKIKTASANANVGIRTMDTNRVGYIKTDGKTPVSATNPPKMGLEGALRAPTTESTLYPKDNQPDAFQKDVADLLALYNPVADTPSVYGDAKMDGDPILTIPLYGQPYSKTPNSTIPISLPMQNWYSVINLDPRNRVAAGLGTQVVQKHQEDLMQSAWYQLEVLQKAKNNFAAFGIIMERLSLQYSIAQPEDFVSMARKMTSQVKSSGMATTSFQQLNASATPNALINSASRRIMRSGGSFVKRVNVGKAVNSTSLSTINTNLNAKSLNNFRIKRFDIGSISASNFVLLASSPSPQQIAFNNAFEHFTKRVGSAPLILTAPAVPFNFLDAKNTILSAVKAAPMRLLKTKINLPTAATATISRPPAELIGQPSFPNAMYEALWQMDKEWFLPNMNLIENNTLTLLETNTHFINSYMLGLNQELGREMLWRGYPADLSTTFFRNFWGTDDGSPTPQYNDIEPIQKWLGTPAPSRKSMGQAAQLVLTLRGDLLRKFPNTVIFAAELKRGGDDKLQFQANSNFIFPAFRAELPPDLQFIGFNKSVSEIKDTSSGKQWYFILMEPVGEPRFGLDATFRPNNVATPTRNDLAWEHIGNDAFLTASKKPNLSIADINTWGKDASTMAAFLFQQPFATIIKATDLLTL